MTAAASPSPSDRRRVARGEESSPALLASCDPWPPPQANLHPTAVESQEARSFLLLSWPPAIRGRRRKPISIPPPSSRKRRGVFSCSPGLLRSVTAAASQSLSHRRRVV